MIDALLALGGHFERDVRASIGIVGIVTAQGLPSCPICVRPLGEVLVGARSGLAANQRDGLVWQHGGIAVRAILYHLLPGRPGAVPDVIEVSPSVYQSY